MFLLSTPKLACSLEHLRHVEATANLRYCPCLFLPVDAAQKIFQEAWPRLHNPRPHVQMLQRNHETKILNLHHCVDPRTSIKLFASAI